MVEAFDQLVRAGKVLFVGITDMPFWQFATAYFHAERHDLARFAAVQNHYSLLWREDERSCCDSVGCRASVSFRAALWRAASCTRSRLPREWQGWARD